MTTKQNEIKKIYRLSEKLLSGIHRDDAWQDLHAVFNNLRNNGFEVEIENTQYEGFERKTYWLLINKEHKINGYIVCAFCGSMDDPMSRYDMSMILY